MRTRKITTSLILMGISLILLTVLQALWLRTEYQSAVSSFGREINMTFRATMHQLTDSIFFSTMQGIAFGDSLRPQHKPRPSRSGNILENVRYITIANRTRPDTLEKTAGDTLASRQEIVISMKNTPDQPDSITVRRQINPGQQDMRWIFEGNISGYNKDSIAVHYRRNLNMAYLHLPFTVLEKEFPNQPSPRQSFRPFKDSLPFTTSWYPFARKLYAIEFQNVQWLIIRKLIPQGGFALFTTGLIFVSFLMVYRTLRAQQKLMEQKDNFVSNVSHELKTPVASVGVAIEAIRNFDVLSNRNRSIEYLDHAAKELNRLTLLTDKILKASVLDYSDEIINNLTPVDLTALAAEITDSFRLPSQEKGVELLFEHRGNTMVKANAEHLGQAIYNLIDNAIKYASDGKYIKISVREQRPYTVLSVEDKGPGIAGEYRNKIFEKFFRVPTGNVHNVKGYGLGLHYVAGVVKQHKGKITLHTREGQGCRFEIRLKGLDRD